MRSTSLPELAPLQSFDPEDFVSSGDDEVVAFVLTLALIYNDLHTLLVFSSANVKGAPADRGAITAERGEYSGTEVYLQRLLAGWLEETLQAIKRHEALLQRPEFAACLRRLKNKPARAWAELVRLAGCADVSTQTDASFRRALARIRGNVAFHYYNSRGLLSGFRSFFKTQPGRAYVSLGSTLASTRFYFADAAAQGTMWDAFRDHRLTLYEMLAPLKYVNAALRSLVEAYLDNHGYVGRPRTGTSGRRRSLAAQAR